MRDVFALLSPRRGNHLSAGAYYALALASSLKAHLTALVAEIDCEPYDLVSEAAKTRSDESSLQRSAEDLLARTTELVLSAAALANVACEILPINDESGSLREKVIKCTRVRDVLIADVYGPLHSPRKDLIDGALFRSGRPVIIVPQTTRSFSEETIVVVWDASPSAVRAVHDSLPLLTRARDVTVVSLKDDSAFSDSDFGIALCRYLARWNVNAKFNAIDQEDLSVGMALLAYAGNAKADLLVMGGFAHGIERELVLGSATRDIFRTSLQMPVFLSH